MMGYEIRPFEPADAMAINNDLIEWAWNGVYGEATFAQAARMGPAYTGWYNGQIIGAGGIMVKLPKPTAWALFSAKIPSLKIALDGAIEARRCIERMIADYHLHEVYAGARIDFRKAQRYLHFLGFRPTGEIIGESYEYVRITA